MKHYRKGQSSLEYLMTYGWALLVIVIAGAALYSLGVLNPSSYVRQTCTGFSYLAYQDSRLTTAGAFTLHAINGPMDVTVTAISVNNISLSSLSGSPSLSPSNGAAVILSGSGGPTGTTDDSYSYSVVITYNVTNGISGNKDSATCTGKFRS